MVLAEKGSGVGQRLTIGRRRWPKETPDPFTTSFTKLVDGSLRNQRRHHMGRAESFGEACESTASARLAQSGGRGACSIEIDATRTGSTKGRNSVRLAEDSFPNGLPDP